MAQLNLFEGEANQATFSPKAKKSKKKKTGGKSPGATHTAEVTNEATNSPKLANRGGKLQSSGTKSPKAKRGDKERIVNLTLDT